MENCFCTDSSVSRCPACIQSALHTMCCSSCIRKARAWCKMGCRNGVLAVSDRMGCGNHHERNRNAAFLMGKAVTVTVTKCFGISRLGINDKIY